MEVGGLVNNPKDLWHRRPAQAVPAGGTHLSPALCGSLEHGHPVEWVSRWPALLQEVEPTSDAKYVRFETVYRPEEMPGQKSPFYPWPYQEGLRLDEAMNDLTLLATGLYGEADADRRTARRSVWWCRGSTVSNPSNPSSRSNWSMNNPKRFGTRLAPNEYGFYSNVNPEVSHPRWSQASERRIGELGRRPTLMFNGYAEQVAYLYEGMDLAKYY